MLNYESSTNNGFALQLGFAAFYLPQGRSSGIANRLRLRKIGCLIFQLIPGQCGIQRLSRKPDSDCCLPAKCAH